MIGVGGCQRCEKLSNWAMLSRVRLDDLMFAASRQWGSGSEQHNLVRDIADAMFRDFPKPAPHAKQLS